MARNTSVSLGDHFDQFIAGQVDSGRYGSASEVVRAGLRLLETTESKLEVLRNALIAGERSEEHTSELQSLMRTSYAVFCLKKTTQTKHTNNKNCNNEQTETLLTNHKN